MFVLVRFDWWVMQDWVVISLEEYTNCKNFKTSAILYYLVWGDKKQSQGVYTFAPHGNMTAVWDRGYPHSVPVLPIVKDPGNRRFTI